MITQVPPVHTVFLTARLLRRPTRLDQTEMNRALDTLEATYPFGASGLIAFVGYGVPYFQRLPASLVRSAVPRLRSNTSRPALEEAAPASADVSAIPISHPGASRLPSRSKQTICCSRCAATIVPRSGHCQVARRQQPARRGLVAPPAFRGLLGSTVEPSRVQPARAAQAGRDRGPAAVRLVRPPPEPDVAGLCRRACRRACRRVGPGGDPYVRRQSIRPAHDGPAG